MAAPSRSTVLLAGGSPEARRSVRRILENAYDVVEGADAREVLAVMRDHWVQVAIVLQDEASDEAPGLPAQIRERWPETVRIVMGDKGNRASPSSPEGMPDVFQVMTHPSEPQQILTSVRSAVHLFELERERQRLSLEQQRLGPNTTSKREDRRRILREGHGFDTLIRGANSALSGVVAQARQIATFDVPVLITGEAGSGKADLARALHHGSLRADQPFVEVHCMRGDDASLAIDLFGARRGVVPAIDGRRSGLLEQAKAGTIFFDGVDALSPDMQSALMRLVRDGVYQPVGGYDTVSCEARILSATTDRLSDRVAEGSFRGDLYFALAVTELRMPPLRERPDDVGPLAEHLLAEAAQEHGKAAWTFSEEALRFLARYDWPGNVPELRNEVTRMLIMAQDPVLGSELISRHILQAASAHNGADRRAMDLGVMEGTLKDRVELMEMCVLRETLTRLKWNKSRAAGELGLSRVGLRSKLDRYGIEPRAVVTEEG